MKHLKRQSLAQKFIPRSGLSIIITIILFSVSIVRSENLSVNLCELPITGCRSVDKFRKCSGSFLLQQNPISWSQVDALLPPLFHLMPPENQQAEIDLSKMVRSWLALSFDADKHQGQKWAMSVGNLIEAFQEASGNAEKTSLLIEKLKNEFPLIWEEVKGFLPELVRNDYLFSEDWNPYKTESYKGIKNDGILDRSPFMLVLDGKKHKIFQACTLIYTDIYTLLVAEQDYAIGIESIGVKNIAAYPIEGKIFCGTKDDGSGFLLYDAFYHQNLFFFLNLEYTLRHLVHYQNDRWQMEVCFVEGDLNYMRVTLFYDPVKTTDGHTIGYIKTIWLDVDVKNIPEREKDRICATRINLGNAKRWVERGVKTNLSEIAKMKN